MSKTPNLSDQIGTLLPVDFWNRPVLVAVSGGSDSVGLLAMLARIQQDDHPSESELHVVHFDHQWGAHSHQTSEFVASLAARHGAAFHGETLESRVRKDGLKLQGQPPRLSSLGPEATARQLRYRFFEELADHLSAGYLLTGHTREDQAETILMRILRGTSIDGLAGIRPARALTNNCQLLRPLLGIQRATIQQYLSDCHQPFVEDPSNDDISLTRNRIRKQVLPFLAEVIGQELTAPLTKLGESASDWKAIWSYVSDSLKDARLESEPGQVCVHVKRLEDVPEPVIRQQLIEWWQQAALPQKEMNREHWMRLTRLAVRPLSDTGEATSWPAEFHFPGPVLARRSGGVLTIKRMSNRQN